MAVRALASIVAVVLLSTPLGAQDGLRSASLPEHPVTAPPPTRGPDLYRVGPGAFTHVDRRRPRIPPGVYGGGGYGGWGPWGPYPYVEDYSAAALMPQPGYLQVLASPVSAQVYVDGLYIGIVDDLRRTIPGRSLDAGAHHVELRAEGYLPSTRDVRIDSGETTLVRATLSPVAPPPAAPNPVAAAAAAPRTFYVIPGCYAGDRRPQADRLPSGCRIAALRVVPPEINQTGGRAPAR
jgi:hypothetical protein